VLKPVGGCQQVFGEGGKPAHRMWVAINGHADVNLGCAMSMPAGVWGQWHGLKKLRRAGKFLVFLA